ncbi:MAG: hypothetical protein H0T42_14905 [Deltaproteobacteria bacterium]|nr:hypothetical protein [Deltaproteobacteria bacterium]
MKDLLPLVLLFGACSASAKQTATDPAPSGTTTTPSGATTSTTTSPPGTPLTACPTLQIKAPDVVASGQTGQVTLTATDAGGTPALTWAVTGGTIESGQGTPAITVRANNVPTGKSITATVTVGNLPAECETKSASATFVVGS